MASGRRSASTGTKRSPLTVADVPPARLAALQAGAAETRVLAESLAMDLAALAETCVPALGGDAIDRLRAAGDTGISRRMALFGRLVVERLTPAAQAALAAHRSDMLRGVACFAIGAEPDRPLAARLEAVQRFADDPHVGVREWAWLAVRPHIAAAPEAAIASLAPWTGDGSDRVRRFATEATRPRGVWSAHLPLLKANPALGLPVLEPLRADPSRYVQDSVANWLNDAAKDQPDWVAALVERWAAACPGPATDYIRRRAMRSRRPPVP